VHYIARVAVPTSESYTPTLFPHCTPSAPHQSRSWLRTSSKNVVPHHAHDINALVIQKATHNLLMQCPLPRLAICKKRNHCFPIINTITPSYTHYTAEHRLFGCFGPGHVSFGRSWVHGFKKAESYQG